MFKNPNFYKALLVLSILVFGYTVFDFYQYQNRRENNAFELGRSKNAEIKLLLDSTTNVIINLTNEFAKNLSENNYTKQELIDFIVQTSEKTSIGLGVTVAFEPFKFDINTKLYAPYYDRTNGNIIDIAEIYDYTKDDVETTVWYTGVIEAEEAVWSDPYFAQGVQQLVVDYGVPFYKVNSKGINELSGMVSFTLSLERFSKFVNELSLGQSGYGFISNKYNKLITHPKTEFITNPDLYDQALKANPQFKRLTTEKEGHFNFTSVYTYQESQLYFSELDMGWVLSVIFSPNDLLGSANELDNKLIHIAFMLSWIAFFTSFLLLKVLDGNTRNLWIFSIIFSILTILNIVFIWYINISIKSTREDINDEKIVNKIELSNALDARNNILHKIGYESSVVIPTGIYISDIDFVDAYGVALGGKIWQKINDTLHIQHNFDFVFPQKASASNSVKTTLVSRTHVDDYWLYRYNFIAILQFDFDYSQYPLDFRLLNIQLMYPDIHENRILVPDLEGYTVMNPSTKPGVDVNIFIPEANLITSYFSFAGQDFNSNLGNTDYHGPSEAPVLEFNIFVKRNILNPVISNILPILVIAILIFLLTFTIHKEGGELIEGSALTVIQASGGFFFVLLLAHIQLRRTLLAPELSYLETYYFVMYVIISLVSTGILLYVKTHNYAILEYKNNLIVKLAYWPFLLFTIYIITLFTFY